MQSSQGKGLFKKHWTEIVLIGKEGRKSSCGEPEKMKKSHWYADKQT